LLLPRVPVWRPARALAHVDAESGHVISVLAANVIDPRSFAV